MYMLMTYDVEAKRTDKFKKLLRHYLNHTQYSVFSGDLTEAQAIKLRSELSRLMIAGDRVMEVTTKNRHNVNVVYLTKDDSGQEYKIYLVRARHKINLVLRNIDTR